jgi:hypothetical protein
MNIYRASGWTLLGAGFSLAAASCDGNDVSTLGEFNRPASTDTRPLDPAAGASRCVPGLRATPAAPGASAMSRRGYAPTRRAAATRSERLAMTRGRARQACASELRTKPAASARHSVRSALPATAVDGVADLLAALRIARALDTRGRAQARLGVARAELAVRVGRTLRGGRNVSTRRSLPWVARARRMWIVRARLRRRMIRACAWLWTTRRSVPPSALLARRSVAKRTERMRSVCCRWMTPSAFASSSATSRGTALSRVMIAWRSERSSMIVRAPACRRSPRLSRPRALLRRSSRHRPLLRPSLRRDRGLWAA